MFSRFVNTFVLFFFCFTHFERSFPHDDVSSLDAYCDPPAICEAAADADQLEVLRWMAEDPAGKKEREGEEEKGRKTRERKKEKEKRTTFPFAFQELLTLGF